jgi:hypothetical protein
VCAHLMIIVSSISSTPSRNRFAKTGGTERTIDAFMEQNSSFSFPLRDLFGEPSTSMGGGEPFRLISGAGAGAIMSQCRRRVQCCSVYLALVGPEFRRMPWSLRGGLWRSLHSQSIIHSPGTFEGQGTVWYVSGLVFYGAPTTQYFLSLVRPENYYTNPHHGDSNIWEGTTGGRPASCKKCAAMRDFLLLDG